MRKLKKNTQSAKVKCIQMQPEMFELLVGGGGREAKGVHHFHSIHKYLI
jgi:hypothetical protein